MVQMKFLPKNKDVRLLRRTSHNSKQRQFIHIFMLLIVILSTHVVAMYIFEGFSWFDSLWLTMTTVTTVGYGDYSATTDLGRLSTILLLYLAGIGVLAQSATLYFEFRQDRRIRILSGNWKWNMKDHIVIFNSPQHASVHFFQQLVSQLRCVSGDIASQPVLIVSPHLEDGLPDNLRSLDVAHVNQVVNSMYAFQYSNVARAATVLLLAYDETDLLSDSINCDLVGRIREVNEDALVVVECVSDENRSRLINIGASLVTRPNRSYPELLARAIIAPGASQILEELFVSNHKSCIKFDSPIKGQWREIIKSFLNSKVGLPIGYVDPEGKTIINSAIDGVIDAVSIYIIVREDQHINQDLLNSSLSRFHT